MLSMVRSVRTSAAMMSSGLMYPKDCLSRWLRIRVLAKDVVIDHLELKRFFRLYGRKTDEEGDRERLAVQ